MPKPEKYATKKHGTRYRVRFRQDGVHRSRTFSTEPEAKQLCKWIDGFGLERALDELDAKRGESDEMRLDEWAGRHFDSLTGVTPGTLSTYRRIYARTWSPTLGGLRLSQITREMLALAVLNIDASDKTVANAWGVLAHMLKVAVMDGHLDKNPGVGVKMPKRTAHTKAEHRYLTHGEWWDLVDATPTHWKPFVWMLGGTGMRWGEAVALNVGDVDLEHATVRISKAEKWDVGNRSERVIGVPKTIKSRRVVTLPPEVVDIIRPLVEGRPSTDALFLAPKGGTVQHRTFYADIWRKHCCKAVPEPAPRIHDLRHSHVAWLIAEGVPLPVIQARVGHEKITTTVDTYGHLMPDLVRAAADAASRVLGARPMRPIALEQ